AAAEREELSGVESFGARRCSTAERNAASDPRRGDQRQWPAGSVELLLARWHGQHDVAHWAVRREAVHRLTDVKCSCQTTRLLSHVMNLTSVIGHPNICDYKHAA